MLTDIANCPSCGERHENVRITRPADEALRGRHGDNNAYLYDFTCPFWNALCVVGVPKRLIRIVEDVPA